MTYVRLSRRRFLKVLKDAGVVTSAVALGACGEDTANPGDFPRGGKDAGFLDGSLDGGLDGDAGLVDGGFVDAPDAGDVEGSDAGAPDAGPPEDPSALWEDPFAFPVGVGSGDVDEGGAVLWTRFYGTGEVLVRVWEMEGEASAETYVALVHEAFLSPSDGFLHVDVGDLAPHTRYRFAFFRLDADGAPAARSPIGRFRTAPSADALVPVTFGAGCCTEEGAFPFPVLAHAGSRDDLDFFVVSGDMAYLDGARTLAEYRAGWRDYLGTAGYRALRASTSVYATWDDHEVDNNWNPESIDEDQLAVARAAFFEHHALRRDPVDPDRIWRSHRWGRTLEVFVLDCRAERRPSTRQSDEAEYISPAQMEWLKASLLASDAVFKVIVNTVPITNFPNVFDVASPDRWEGYPAQREEILSFIDVEGIEGVWWLSGDFHFGCVAKVERDGAYASQREILAGPSGQNPNPAFTVLTGDQFDFKTGRNNYVVIRAQAEPSPVLDVAFVDENGEEIFRRAYDG